jgi:hypothetical protein
MPRDIFWLPEVLFEVVAFLLNMGDGWRRIEDEPNSGDIDGNLAHQYLRRPTTIILTGAVKIACRRCGVRIAA